MLEKVIVCCFVHPQTPCAHAIWSLFVRTESSVCFNLWFVTASNTVKTDLMRTQSTLDVVRNTHMIYMYLRKPHSFGSHVPAIQMKSEQTCVAFNLVFRRRQG